MSESMPEEPEAQQAEELLSQSDTAIARVLEDLIDVLITRGVIQFTDLPQAAQNKLLSRRQTRARLKDSLQLLPGDGDGGLL
jgi:hypothetical protein